MDFLAEGAGGEIMLGEGIVVGYGIEESLLLYSATGAGVLPFDLVAGACTSGSGDRDHLGLPHGFEDDGPLGGVIKAVSGIGTHFVEFPVDPPSTTLSDFQG